VAYPLAHRAESLAPTVAYPSRSRSRHIPLPTEEEANAMEDAPVSRKAHEHEVALRKYHKQK
jgi:hypothetical protein